jgi:hypothetical protein
MNEVDNIWQSKELWAAGLQALAGVFQALATIAAVWLAYRAGLRQLRKQAGMQVQEDWRRRQADALQAAWALLQCMTVTENGHNFLHYEQDKKTEQGQPERRYFVHLPNAQAFVFERLPTAFYASGAGLHWPQAVKDKIFECRGLLYGYLLAEQQAHAPEAQAPSDPLRLVLRPALAQRLEHLYDELNALLRKEMQAVYAPKP